jgi:hypothetical protein
VPPARRRSPSRARRSKPLRRPSSRRAARASQALDKRGAERDRRSGQRERDADRPRDPDLEAADERRRTDVDEGVGGDQAGSEQVPGDHERGPGGERRRHVGGGAQACDRCRARRDEHVRVRRHLDPTLRCAGERRRARPGVR